MADGLAYLVSSITPGELLDLEKGRCNKIWKEIGFINFRKKIGTY